MQVKRQYKAALIEKVTGINAVTLRSWRRKGLLSPMGFAPDGTTANYSFVDACVLSLVTTIEERAMVAMPESLALAIELKTCFHVMIDENDEPKATWNLWAHVDHRGAGIFKINIFKDPGEWIRHQSLWGNQSIILLINLGEAARQTAMRFKAVGIDISGSDA